MFHSYLRSRAHGCTSGRPSAVSPADQLSRASGKWYAQMCNTVTLYGMCTVWYNTEWYKRLINVNHVDCVSILQKFKIHWRLDQTTFNFGRSCVQTLMLFKQLLRYQYSLPSWCSVTPLVRSAFDPRSHLFPYITGLINAAQFRRFASATGAAQTATTSENDDEGSSRG